MTGTRAINQSFEILADSLYNPNSSGRSARFRSIFRTLIPRRP